MQKKHYLSRRDFVKTSAMLAGGLALTQLPIEASAHVSGADTIRVGLIGCGGRGSGAALQALSTKQNVKLVAMADAFRNRIDDSYKNLTNPDNNEWSGTGKITDRIDVPEERKFVGFDAYEKVLPLVDVVILATPPGFRPTHFEAAIKAGKHVFMEKPVAVDAPGVRKVLEAAEMAKQKKLNVVVGLQRHYQSVYREWVKRLQEGAIGDIHTSHVYWNDEGVWVNERQKNQTEMEYQMRNWYYFNWLCGDHINEQHIHNLDVSNWVKGAYPVRAHGMGGRQVRNGKEFGEIFDHHFVEYEYADGSRMFSQCRHIKGCMKRVSESFQGTSGSAPQPGLIKTAKGYTQWEHRGKNDPNPYQVEHDELFDAIEKGEYRFWDAENGAKSTMTAVMGRMATYSGQLIEWDKALASDINLMPPKLSWDAMPLVLPDKNGFYPVAIPGVTKAV
ncbi:MAG: twin-arginine translocation signal domain-containing protein [Bacteroidetes bacterium]|nr:MAG: twin-arginine translocation signal domain-containing protein [Bacteroidota bacterium]